MKKILLSSIVLLAATIGGGLAYAWHRTTALPSWYETAAVVTDSVPPPTPTPVSTPELILSQVKSDPADNQQVTITLDEAHFNQIVTSSAASDPRTAALLAASQGIKTRIEDDRIESGTVINLSEVPTKALTVAERGAIAQLTNRFPMLAHRDIYVGVAGQPQIINGELQWADNTVIKVGQMAIPLQEVANQLGLSPETLAAKLSETLTQEGIQLEDLTISEGQVTVTGSNQTP